MKLMHADTTMQPDSQPSRSTLARVIGWAVALFALDALVLNEGFIAGAVAFWLIAFTLPRSLLSRYQSVRRERLRNVGILMIAVALVFGFNWLSNVQARMRAESVASAVHAFQTKYGRYPQRLDDLVPEFLPTVPRAKYTLSFGEFRYFVSTNGIPRLQFTDFPPFGRPTYSFESNSWRYVD
jgi:hypothetical protein